jgi:hypothetical protein
MTAAATASNFLIITRKFDIKLAILTLKWTPGPEYVVF